MAWIVGLWPGSRTTTGPVPAGTWTGAEEIVGGVKGGLDVDWDGCEREVVVGGCGFDVVRAGDLDARRWVVGGVLDAMVLGSRVVEPAVAEVVALVDEPALLHALVTAAADSATTASTTRHGAFRRRYCATAEL